MAHFMAAFTWKEAPDPALFAAEGAAAQRLLAGGHLRLLFLAGDSSRGWGVWRAESADAVLRALEVLPLRRYMDITVTELADAFSVVAPGV